MRRLIVTLTLFFSMILNSESTAEGKKITIIHTNDLHSHLLGTAPNIEYTPTVTGEEDGYTPLDYSESNHTLLRIAADIYNATFLKIIGKFTFHILDIIPKDSNGNPIDDLKTARVDADKRQPGIQELKEWKAVMGYIQSFPDTDGDGIPNIPEKYRGKLGRITAETTWNPYGLLKGGSYVTWTAFAVLVFTILVFLVLGRLIIRKVRKK